MKDDIQVTLKEVEYTSNQSIVASLRVLYSGNSIEINEMRIKEAICSELGLPHHAKLNLAQVDGTSDWTAKFERNSPRKKFDNSDQEVFNNESNGLDAQVRKLKLENKRLQQRLKALEIQSKTDSSNNKNISTRSHSSCVGQIIPDCPILDINTRESKKLHDILTSKEMYILDFWSTKCPNCPSAIELMKKKAIEFSDRPVAFICINTDDPDLAQRIISKNSWDRLSHYHISLQYKEVMKDFLGMRVLPHATSIGKDRVCLYNGKTFLWDTVSKTVRDFPINQIWKQKSRDNQVEKVHVSPEGQESPESPKFPNSLAIGKLPVFTIDEDF